MLNRRGAKTDPFGTLLLRRRGLLRLLLPVVRVKPRFPTSSIHSVQQASQHSLQEDSKRCTKQGRGKKYVKSTVVP